MIENQPYFLLGSLECINGNERSVLPLSFIYRGIKPSDYESSWIEFSNSFFEDSSIQKISFKATHIFSNKGIESLDDPIIFDDIFRLKEGVNDEISNDV